ncbi:AraC family transcriptional regulator [Alienimonas chondri]|uniref:HTH-type transcriptional activator RhaR n=1 Tax=Alienimonas chondri TaxID=2681879 RepID=A0ABX1VB26_9PLAN|nr:AraC family transcriptional regulator [Alienimonas chondri]NNJ25273.1 HTH-type transcriptional activator RhaR [Alienimonas chondri]
MTSHEPLAALLASLAEPFTAESIFDRFQDVVYFIKDAECRYVAANETLMERCGVRRRSEMLGRTAEEVFPPPLGRRFTVQDRAILRSEKPLIGKLERHHYANRSVGWCLTDKYPLSARGGGAAGIVGFSRDLTHPNESGEDYRHIAEAVAFASRRLAEPVNVLQMAQVAELSRYQLDRRMKIAFGLNSGQWLLKQRIDLACRRLTSTDSAIAAIALEVGYADQSAFSRQFRRTTGMTPGEYRRSM